MGKDLGSYFIKVELENERGFISKIDTGHGFTKGSFDCSPIDASPITPTWTNEEELIDSMLYMWLEGNSSCDCNVRLMVSMAYQEEKGSFCCGENLTIKKLPFIKPKR